MAMSIDDSLKSFPKAILLGVSPGGLNSAESSPLQGAIDEGPDGALIDRILKDRRLLAGNRVLHASAPPGLTFTFHGVDSTEGGER